MLDAVPGHLPKVDGAAAHNVYGRSPLDVTVGFGFLSITCPCN